VRTRIKRELARLGGSTPAGGATVLIYHRVGGGSPDELDVSADGFARQLDALAGHAVLPLDGALDRLAAGDDSPTVVLTFDDGFQDVYANAWPLLRDRGLPFTLYLATAFLGGTMAWEGSTAKAGGPALSWDQVAEMVGSGLCTPGNHTHRHVPPTRLTEAELDECSAAVEANVGLRPRHFAYPWGIPVPVAEPGLRARFRSAATGHLGRNLPDTDPLRLHRVPVRRTDPLEFFRAKLAGGLLPERAYAGLVTTAKRVGVRG
jgi:peptidoglycan/xylan/chitin deacetylase (PgdA/CDA1 family)